jgi:hypothetical protein
MAVLGKGVVGIFPSVLRKWRARTEPARLLVATSLCRSMRRACAG